MAGLIGAIGSLVGGLIGRNEQRRSQKQALKFEKHKLRYLARDARGAGIHPYAALGAASGYSNPFGGVSGMGDAVADAAASVDDYVASKAPPDALAKAQLDVLNSEALRNRAEAAAATAEATSRTRLAGMRAAGMGATTGVAPIDMYIKVRAPDGRIVNMPNPLLPDGDQIAAVPIFEGLEAMANWNPIAGVTGMAKDWWDELNGAPNRGNPKGRSGPPLRITVD